MKKYILLSLVLLSLNANSQWIAKTIKSDFDGSFKKAYTKDSGVGYLIMEAPVEEDSTSPFFALSGSYFCDDVAYIDFILVVKGENKKYSLKGTKSRDSRMYYFEDEVWNDEFISDFKNASKCLIRVNQDYCTNEYYDFNMSGSTQAYNFVIKK